MNARRPPVGGDRDRPVARDAGTPRPVEVCRVYDPTRLGHCVLVDRLWPRGISHAAADVDEWLPEIGPSTELRQWYGHQVERFEEFADRYRGELHGPPADALVARLAGLSPDEVLTLVTATRDVEHSAARVLRDVLRATR